MATAEYFRAQLNLATDPLANHKRVIGATICGLICWACWYTALFLAHPFPSSLRWNLWNSQLELLRFIEPTEKDWLWKADFSPSTLSPLALLIILSFLTLLYLQTLQKLFWSWRIFSMRSRQQPFWNFLQIRLLLTSAMWYMSRWKVGEIQSWEKRWLWEQKI